MNNLKLYENTILVKADKKTQEYLTSWGEQKKEEWINRQRKLGIEVNIEEIEQRELKGDVLPYEKQLIPQYEEIKLEFREALEDHSAGAYVEVSESYVGKKATKDKIEDVSRSTTKGQND